MKANSEFSFNSRKLVWLEKNNIFRDKNLSLFEICGYLGFDVIAKSMSGPFFSVTGMTSGIKQLLASRERTLEFPALLLCRFKC